MSYSNDTKLIKSHITISWQLQFTQLSLGMKNTDHFFYLFEIPNFLAWNSNLSIYFQNVTVSLQLII